MLRISARVHRLPYASCSAPSSSRRGAGADAIRLSQIGLDRSSLEVHTRSLRDWRGRSRNQHPALLLVHPRIHESPLLQSPRPTINVALRIRSYHDRGASEGAHRHSLRADLIQNRWLRLDSGEVIPLAHQSPVFDIDQGIVKNHVESAVII